MTTNKKSAIVPKLMEKEATRMNQLSFFENLDALKIMLVLYRDNPDVSLINLQKEVHITKSTLEQILANLISEELVHVKQDGKEPLFTLSKEARMSLNRLQVPRTLIKITT